MIEALWIWRMVIETVDMEDGDRGSSDIEDGGTRSADMVDGGRQYADMKAGVTGDASLKILQEK